MTAMKHKLLADLKKDLKAAERARIQAVASRPAPVAVEEDERSLLNKALQGVTPLAPNNTIVPQPTRLDRHEREVRRAHAEGPEELPGQAISDTLALLHPVASEAQLAFRRVGVQIAQFRKMQEGQLPWRAAVDLHGCTVEQARQAVLQLLHEASTDGINVVKIVHGKGYSQQAQGALLKTCVNGWLQQHAEVLAFCSAPAREGGNGAVLVLLRRTPAAKAATREARERKQ